MSQGPAFATWPGDDSEELVSRTNLARLAAATGVTSVVVLFLHSMMLGGQPTEGAGTTAIADFLVGHHTAVLTSTWLDGFGSVLLILFVYAVVHLAGPAAGFGGALATRVATPIIALSLVIDAALIGASRAADAGHDGTAGTLWSLATGMDNVFPVANSVWMPLLGVVLLPATVLPRAYAPIVIAIGAAEFVIGTAAVFSPAFTAANNLVFIGFMAWMLAASIALAVRAGKLATGPDLSFVTT